MERTEDTYLGDWSLHSVPGVTGNGRGWRLFSSTWLGFERSHGLGDSGGKSELLSQLNIGSSLSCNKQTQMLVTRHANPEKSQNCPKLLILKPFLYTKFQKRSAKKEMK